MSGRRRLRGDGQIYPTDMRLMQDLFRRMCKEKGLDPNSPEADELAARVILPYQQGAQDEAAMKVLISRIRR